MTYKQDRRRMRLAGALSDLVLAAAAVLAEELRVLRSSYGTAGNEGKTWRTNYAQGGREMRLHLKQLDALQGAIKGARRELNREA